MLAFEHGVQAVMPSPANPLLHAHTKSPDPVPACVHPGFSQGTGGVIIVVVVLLLAGNDHGNATNALATLHRALHGIHACVTGSANKPAAHMHTVPELEVN